MKNYRCVFLYPSGSTTIEVTAADGEKAITAAAEAIDAGDYDRVEIWDGAVLVVTRATPRSWNALETPQVAASASSLPRRPAANPLGQSPKTGPGFRAAQTVRKGVKG